MYEANSCSKPRVSGANGPERTPRSSTPSTAFRSSSPKTGQRTCREASIAGAPPSRATTAELMPLLARDRIGALCDLRAVRARLAVFVTVLGTKHRQDLLGPLHE